MCAQMPILPEGKELKPEQGGAARHVKRIREEGGESKLELNFPVQLWVEEDWELIPPPCDSVYGFILHYIGS